MSEQSVWSAATLALIEAAIDEDLGTGGDVSSALLDEPDAECTGLLVSRAPGVLCGRVLLPAVCAAFGRRLDAELVVEPARRVDDRLADFSDGDAIRPGVAFCRLRGPRAGLLTAERTLLNFLTRMSGVATLTRQFVEAARAVSPAVQIVDTRKTIPGWRELDKYAVRCGGGVNHRMGLYDAVLIKDNHLAGVTDERFAAAAFELLNRLGPAAAPGARRPGGKPAFVEVEVDTLGQFRAVLDVVGVDVVLLDNMSPETLRAAVELRERRGLRGRLLLEASGGVTLENVAAIAASGVDRIAVGALTHSAAGLDIGLDLESGAG